MFDFGIVSRGKRAFVEDLSGTSDLRLMQKPSLRRSAANDKLLKLFFFLHPFLASKIYIKKRSFTTE